MGFPLVDGCIDSEFSVFFELRVRYLLSSERVSEAMALAKCCAQHPTTGQHLFFLQVYLTWLHKTSQRDRLHKEVGGCIRKNYVFQSNGENICFSRLYRLLSYRKTILLLCMSTFLDLNLNLAMSSVFFRWLTLVVKKQFTLSVVWSVRKRMICY